MSRLFPVGIPVTGELLIDRKDELKKIESLLEIGQSVVLVSPRRYGKTSVALELIQRLKKKGFFVVYIDIFSILNHLDLAEQLVEKTLENKKIKNFARIVKEKVSDLLKNIEFKHVIDDFEFVLNFKDEKKDEWRLLKNSLDFPDRFAEKHGKKMVVIIDEFGDLSKLDGLELLKLMRSLFQRHRLTSYLFTGSQESIMHKLFLNRKQPFFRFGVMMKLENLPKDETVRFISKIFKKEEIALSDNVIDIIFEKSGGIAYYVQLICQKVYLGALGKDKKSINKDDVENAYFEAISDEKGLFEELWVELLGRAHYCEVLRQIITSKESLYSIPGLKEKNLARILKNLKDKGIIVKKEGRYVMKDPLFRDFLRLRFEEKIL